MQAEPTADRWRHRPTGLREVRGARPRSQRHCCVRARAFFWPPHLGSRVGKARKTDAAAWMLGTLGKSGRLFAQEASTSNRGALRPALEPSEGPSAHRPTNQKNKKKLKEQLFRSFLGKPQSRTINQHPPPTGLEEAQPIPLHHRGPRAAIKIERQNPQPSG